MISIRRTERNTFLLETEQWLPGRPEEVFPFFADPSNLADITPDWLKFEIRTPLPIDLHAGARLDYRLRWHGIPLRWATEISVWKPPHLFVDVQLRGPYRLWRHEHLFLEFSNATLMRDRVEYDMLCAPLANRLGVERDLRQVFTFRRQRLERRFGEATTHQLRARFAD